MSHWPLLNRKQQLKAKLLISELRLNLAAIRWTIQQFHRIAFSYPFSYKIGKTNAELDSAPAEAILKAITGYSSSVIRFGSMGTRTS